MSTDSQPQPTDTPPAEAPDANASIYVKAAAWLISEQENSFQRNRLITAAIAQALLQGKDVDLVKFLPPPLPELVLNL